MAAGGSTRVVVIALLANGGIAVAKLLAALATGSGAMLAESIHSFADCGNQGLLLLGHSRARRPADDRHPLGYGREAYFWALLVAVTLFTLGGLFSLYEGIHKFADPHELQHVPWAVGVLSLGIVLEGYSLLAAWRAVKALRGADPVLEWARETGDVNLLVVLFEDIAAMAGLVLALLAVLLAWATGDSRYDAAGSCVVGIVLLVVAVFLGYHVRRLIVGFAVSERVRQDIREIWAAEGFEVLRIIAVWSGVDAMLVAVKVRPVEDVGGTETIRRINGAERLVRARFPQVAFQFAEPDLEV